MEQKNPLLDRTRAALTLPTIDLVLGEEQPPPRTDSRPRVHLFEQHGHVRLYLTVQPNEIQAAAEIVAAALATSGLRAVRAELPDHEEVRTADVLTSGTGQIVEGLDPQDTPEEASEPARRPIVSTAAVHRAASW